MRVAEAAGPTGSPSAKFSIERVDQARALLRGVIRATPSAYTDSLSRKLSREIWLKPEFRQRTGSFKIRGAYTMQSTLGDGAAVVAGSAGNHAQGVALAASLLGQQATIFMPTNASLPKVQATMSYGARVLLGHDTVDDCIEAAREFAADEGATFVPPFDHPDIVAGQATIGLELIDEVPDLGAVLVAIGGGGLCAGVAAAIKARRPEVQIIGVVAEGGIDRRVVGGRGAPVGAAADDCRRHRPAGPATLTLELIRDHVDEVVTVSDEAISRAMLLLVERAKSVVEPAGAAPLAALLEGRVPTMGGSTAVLLGGGNVDPLLLGKLIEHGMSVAGRFLVFRAVMSDRPGSLAMLSETLAEMGLNVLDVEHHRTGVRLPLSQVEMQVTVETATTSTALRCWHNWRGGATTWPSLSDPCRTARL